MQLVDGVFPASVDTLPWQPVGGARKLSSAAFEVHGSASANVHTGFRPARLNPVKRFQRFVSFYRQQRRYRLSRQTAILMAVILSRRFERATPKTSE